MCGEGCRSSSSSLTPVYVPSAKTGIFWLAFFIRRASNYDAGNKKRRGVNSPVFPERCSYRVRSFPSPPQAGFVRG